MVFFNSDKSSISFIIEFVSSLNLMFECSKVSCISFLKL